MLSRRYLTNAFPVIGTLLPELPVTRSPRSKRLRKKLLRRGAKPLYGDPVVLSLGPKVLRALEALRASR